MKGGVYFGNLRQPGSRCVTRRKSHHVSDAFSNSWQEIAVVIDYMRQDSPGALRRGPSPWKTSREWKFSPEATEAEDGLVMESNSLIPFQVLGRFGGVSCGGESFFNLFSGQILGLSPVLCFFSQKV